MDLSPIAKAVAAEVGGLVQFRSPGWSWDARRGDHPVASIVHLWRRRPPGRRVFTTPVLDRPAALREAREALRSGHSRTIAMPVAG